MPTPDYFNTTGVQLFREVASFVTPNGERLAVTEQQVPLGAYAGNAKIARLTCSCHEYQRALVYPWCQHVDKVVQEEVDGKTKEYNESYKADLPPVVEVPIFVHPPLGIPVVLGRGPMENSRSVAVNGEHLGYIFLGQGRRSIRLLVIEWLVEKSVNLPVCRSTHHYALLPWEYTAVFDPRNKYHLTNLADLILTDQCRRCNEDDGVPDV